MSKPTIMDIARLANVSTATVSRAIHQPDRVAPETLQRVNRVLAQNNYVYNATAGDLSRRKSSVLGLFIPTAESAKLSTTAIALQNAVSRYGYPIIINNTLFDARLESEQLRQCQERSLAGLIFVGCMQQNEPLVYSIARDEVPCIFLWDTLIGTSYNYIGIDNFGASYEMVQYLVKLGHRRIAFVGALSLHVSRVQKRLNGYLQAIKEYRLEERGEYILEFEPTLSNGYLAMRSFLSLPEPPTAVFFASDMLAMGALRACHEAGLSVPGDMSIAGFDDIEFASYAMPSLTTIKVPAKEIGTMAGQAMVEILRGIRRGPFQHCLPTTIVLRESCARPKV